MKKYLLFFFLINEIVAKGQVTFQKVFSGNNKQIWSGAICNAPGNRFALIGGFYDNNVNLEKGYVLLMNDIGDTLWFKSIQDTADISISDIILSPDSSLIAIGESNNEIVFIKLNLSGDVLLSKSIGAANTHLYNAKIINAIDSGFLILSTITNSTAIIKINSSGDVEWSKRFAIPPGDVTTTADSGFIIGGWVDHYPNQDLLAGLLLKVDSVGLFQWSSEHHYYGNDVIPSTIHQLANGNYVFAGLGLHSFHYDFCMAEVNLSGNLLWNRAYKTGYYSVSRIFGFVSAEDNGFMINSFGYPYDLGITFLSSYVIKTDSLGNSGCYDTTGTMTQTVLNPTLDTVLIIDSLIVISSQNKSFISDSSLNITNLCFSVGIQYEIPHPQSEILLTPNPTTGQLNIGNMQSAIKKIEIYNLPGKQVGSWQYEIGKREITIDLTKLSAGIYFLQASDGESVWRGKVIKE